MFAQDQVQAWIAQNPQLAQAIVQAMTTPQPNTRYAPVSQPNQNWGTGRNAFLTNQTPAQSSMPMLHGRVITNPQEIKPNEIPMDGSASLFPMNDDSCIYAKAWKPDGGIDTIRYIREDKVEPPQSTATPDFTQMMTRLDRIERILDSSISIGQDRYPNRRQNYNNRNAQTSQNDISKTTEVTTSG